MVERRQRMATVLSALLLILTVVLFVIGVRYITINFIKVLVFGILGLWVISKAL